jgi:hypothetical protein
MSQDGFTMKSDKALDADIANATTPDEIRELLHRAVERSTELGITRDPVTGQFVRTERAAPTAEEVAAKAASDAAAAAKAAEPREFKQTVRIAGQDFDFTANSAEALQLQIDSAKAVAQQLGSIDHSVRTPEQDALNAVDADLALRRGEITTAEFLRRTHALEDAMTAAGVNVNQIADSQFEHSWQTAGEEFQQSEAGRDWPGGQKNYLLLSDKIIAMGLLNDPDKVGALEKAYAALKEAGTLFDGDVSQAQVEKLAEGATPAEILQAWKDAQGDMIGDASKANEVFLNTFANGRSSSMFGR